MKARPLQDKTIPICGGKTGYIRLHYNQRWEVTLFKDDDKNVGLEYKFLSLVMEKGRFKELFGICEL